MHYKRRWVGLNGIFDFIEGWYNPHRRHSAIGYLSPTTYERRSQAA
jgi:putative transposase